MKDSLKVCFVCTGNTCRSVMAEHIFKKMLKEHKIDDIKVFSKGFNALGDNIAENAKIVLKEKGIRARDRKSVKLKKIEKNTLYVVMNNDAKEKINGKVISMTDLMGKDVLDPYGQGVEIYRQTLSELELGSKVLLEKIIKFRGGK